MKKQYLKYIDINSIDVTVNNEITSGAEVKMMTPVMERGYGVGGSSTVGFYVLFERQSE